MRGRLKCTPEAKRAVAAMKLADLMAEEEGNVTQGDEVSEVLGEGGETPEMPVQKEVRGKRGRVWEEAFNDVDVELTVVLGRAWMPINQLLKMGRGAVIELGANVDDDAQLYANNRLIARGQVILVGENIAVSITETVPVSES